MSLNRLIQALDFSETYEAKVARAADYIRGKLGNTKHVFGVILGSGLGELADSIEGAIVIPYCDIPDFPALTVPGHEGKMAPSQRIMRVSENSSKIYDKMLLLWKISSEK